jgi:DNA polymerase V
MSTNNISMSRYLVPLKPAEATTLGIPIFGYVNAGFPSPAQDYIEDRIDLTKAMINNPAETFLLRVTGSGFIDEMEEGDLLLIDRSIKPRSNDVILCFANGEYAVKRIIKKANRVFIQPLSRPHPVTEMKEGGELVVWGVVTYIMKKGSA